MSSIDMAEYMRNRRSKRRMDAIQELGGLCKVCGCVENLQIDHVDASIKSFTVSGKDLDRSWSAILGELKKCQLLCHRHHREKTILAGETGGGHNRILNPQHGTERMYRKGCKCGPCRKWKKDYRNKLVDCNGQPKAIPL